MYVAKAGLPNLCAVWSTPVSLFLARFQGFHFRNSREWLKRDCGVYRFVVNTACVRVTYVTTARGRSFADTGGRSFEVITIYVLSAPSCRGSPDAGVSLSLPFSSVQCFVVTVALSAILHNWRNRVEFAKLTDARWTLLKLGAEVAS